MSTGFGQSIYDIMKVSVCRTFIRKAIELKTKSSFMSAVFCFPRVEELENSLVLE